MSNTTIDSSARQRLALVKEKLSLSDGQLDSLWALRSDFEKKRLALQKKPGLTMQQRSVEFRKILDEQDWELKKILNAEQFTQLKRMQQASEAKAIEAFEERRKLEDAKLKGKRPVSDQPTSN